MHKIPPPSKPIKNNKGLLKNKPQGPSNETITLPKSLTYILWLCIFGVVFVGGWGLGFYTAAGIN